MVTAITIRGMETNTTTDMTRCVASNLRAVMARRGYRIRDLATVLGVSTATASTRYNGTHPLDLDEMPKITAWLGIGWADLLAPTIDAELEEMSA